MTLLIKNGTIVDGSGSERFKADLMIEGDKIVEVGKDLKADGAEIIDAKDKIVAPGFIDIHNHADMTILDKPKLESYIMQGVTTIIGGLCGFGIAPANDLVKKYYCNLNLKNTKVEILKNSRIRIKIQ